jgi:hypothetical protein
MLNRIIYGDDILAQAKSLAIKALYIKWKTLSQLKRLTLTDFFEGDDKARGNFIVMLATGDDYAVIYHGAEYRKALGRDLSGKLISESDTRVSRAMRQIYDQVREMGIPVRLIYASDTTQFAVGWERVILPIKLAGEVRLLISYSEPLNTAGDIHNFLFENSPHMLIVALPIADYEEEIVDADIIQANPTAARFFNTEGLHRISHPSAPARTLVRRRRHLADADGQDRRRRARSYSGWANPRADLQMRHRQTRLSPGVSHLSDRRARAGRDRVTAVAGWSEATSGGGPRPSDSRMSLRVASLHPGYGLRTIIRR